ncbi:MAG: magnesium/cobalt transporter CorA [Chitinophagaceae bacterium]
MGSKRNKALQLIPELLKPKKRRIAYDPAQEPPQRRADVQSVYSVFHYNATELLEQQYSSIKDHQDLRKPGYITWINADGLKKEEVEQLCQAFEVHPLLVEDILSIGQRAKMDEMDNRMFCLLPMIYFNNTAACIEFEQVSIVVGENFVLSFQEDATRDVFDPLRHRLRSGGQRLRERKADYLCYSLLDVIVDSYFGVLEKLADKIDEIEDALLADRDATILASISHLRKEVMLMKRSIAPVRELVGGFLRTGNQLVESRHEKYFKDVSDHIIQANDTCENLRDMLSNLQDLYMNRINLRMNEVMKIFTMVSLLLAPATVIGGIFGMNFERIPLLHDQRGFYISVAAMLLIPLMMILYFKRKKWL